MQSFIAKPSTVQAVQYVAPNGADVSGNVDEIKALADVEEQNPWDPAGGQHCLIVVLSDSTALLEDGGYLAVASDGAVSVFTEDEFRAAYEVDSASTNES